MCSSDLQPLQASERHISQKATREQRVFLYCTCVTLQSLRASHIVMAKLTSVGILVSKGPVVETSTWMQRE